MSKFKISLKITGLELSIEGTREDVPLLTQAVSQQITGLLSPASNVIEGEVVDSDDAPALVSDSPSAPAKPVRKKPSRKPRAAAPKSSGETDIVPVSWVHDPEKWGVPQQSWNTAKKACWILYVVSKETGISELDSKTIVQTFNTMFKQSGPILANNTNRDLGKEKGKSPAKVSENTTIKPSKWFLTHAGEKWVEETINEQKSKV
jgi:hypothetical protein